MVPSLCSHGEALLVNLGSLAFTYSNRVLVSAFIEKASPGKPRAASHFKR